VSPVLAPDPPLTLHAEPELHAGARGQTLEDLVTGAWDALLAHAHADCPACGAELQPRHSAGAGVVGGRCGDCGATLE
jgi:hypothetical protein